jgi:uncharacterized protein
MTIRSMTSADLPTVLEINSMNGADVDALSADDLETLLADSTIALVAVDPESSSVVGFCVVIDSSCRLRTERSTWAFERGADLHLDRVAFDMRYSGRGLGLALFDDLDARIAGLADTDALALTSIVRTDPPNAHAVGFHAVRGFTDVDRRVCGDVTWTLTNRSFAPSRST